MHTLIKHPKSFNHEAQMLKTQKEAYLQPTTDGAQSKPESQANDGGHNNAPKVNNTDPTNNIRIPTSTRRTRDRASTATRTSKHRRVPPTPRRRPRRRHNRRRGLTQRRRRRNRSDERALSRQRSLERSLPRHRSLRQALLARDRRQLITRNSNRAATARVRSTRRDRASVEKAGDGVSSGVPVVLEAGGEIAPGAGDVGEDDAGEVFDVGDDGAGFDVVEEVGGVGDGGFGGADELGRERDEDAQDVLEGGDDFVGEVLD